MKVLTILFTLGLIATISGKIFKILSHSATIMLIVFQLCLGRMLQRLESSPELTEIELSAVKKP